MLIFYVGITCFRVLLTVAPQQLLLLIIYVSFKPQRYFIAGHHFHIKVIFKESGRAKAEHLHQHFMKITGIAEPSLQRCFTHGFTGHQHEKMLSDKTIMAFLTTTDPAKARPFFENILRPALKRTEPYAMVFDSNGIGLCISTVADPKPAPYSVMSWIVPDIHDIITGLVAKGVVLERYGFFEQDAVWHTDGAKVAWFKDPDGNLLSLTEY